MRSAARFLVRAMVATLVAGCGLGSFQTLAPGQTPAAPASGQPSAPANAALYGTISFEDSSSFTSPAGDPKGSGNDESTATVHVAMARGAGANAFVDAGSTFSQRQTSHREKTIGIDPSTCVGITDAAGEVVDKSFSAPVAVDDPGSQISVLYSPQLGVFTLLVDTSLPLVTTTNACMSGKATTETHWAGGPLGCGSLGLEGKVTVNPAGPDQVDMACTLLSDHGRVIVSGILTLKD
ncbi:MAG: hypothetical protein HYX55_06420 [Chloroflexi bacterium]|nr:hypothetical protein [Chloroflexota bacterium]